MLCPFPAACRPGAGRFYVVGGSDRLVPTMFIALGLVCIALGVRFIGTRPDAIFQLGPVDVTAYHLMFAAGLLCIVRGIWTWVTD